MNNFYTNYETKNYMIFIRTLKVIKNMNPPTIFTTSVNKNFKITSNGIRVNYCH